MTLSQLQHCIFLFGVYVQIQFGACVSVSACEWANILVPHLEKNVSSFLAKGLDEKIDNFLIYFC